MMKLLHNIKKIMPHTLGGKLAASVLFIWILMAVFSPFLANNVPIVGKSDQGWTMPVFSNPSATEIKYSFQINPMINYRFSDLDMTASLVSPLSPGNKGIHILGTDELGRDIAAGIINGARVALIISSFTIILSLALGVFVGLVIGYYGDHGLKRNLLQQVMLLLATFLLCYYIIDLFRNGISFATLVSIILVVGFTYGINHFLAKLPIKKYGIPIDIIVQRLFEIKESVPGIFLLLASLAIFTKPSLFTIPIILGLLIWLTFARMVRAESLQIREEEYVKAAKASGTPDFRILMRHIFPNTIPSLLVIVAFTFSGVILTESTLSFLGIGLPLEEVSWGKILAEARTNTRAWWLAVFPGLAIFLVLYSFNTLGDLLSNYQRARN